MPVTLSSMGLIALMGSTGSGKSSFANLILNKAAAIVNDGLESATSEVDQYSHRHHNGMDVTIVDTPGFNDFRSEGSKSDLQVLQMISKFLKEKHAADQKFSGVIFMHNINTAKVDWQTSRRNMTLFKKLCGADSMKNVVVVTSFWDELSDLNVGIAREQELQSDEGLLKDLYTGGAKFVRFGHFGPDERPEDPAFYTPQQVVDHLLGLTPVFVEMQKEMADGKSLADTAAGSSLLEEFEKHKREVVKSLDQMRQEIDFIKSADDVNRSHREELKQHARSVQEQLKAWERDGNEMRMKIAQWDQYQEQVATKEQLDALVSRHQGDLGSLQSEVFKLRETNEKLHQMDQERINELNQTLCRVRKDRDDLDEECKRLRAGNMDGFNAQFQSLTSPLTSLNEFLQASFTNREEELKQAREAFARSQQELAEVKDRYRNMEKELVEVKASWKADQEDMQEKYEQLEADYFALEAEYNSVSQPSDDAESLHSTVESLRRELESVRAQKKTLEMRNQELTQAVQDGTEKATKAAAEDKAKVIQQLHKETELRRKEKQGHQRDVKQREDTIAKLQQELDILRNQVPAENAYPSPRSEPSADPYGAWDGPGGGILGVVMPEPSFVGSPPASSYPPLGSPHMPAFHNLAPSSPPTRVPPKLPPRPQPGMPSSPPFPSADIHLGIRFNTGYPESSQQQAPRRRMPPVPRYGAASPGLPARSQTPQLQPSNSGWYDDGNQNAGQRGSRSMTPANFN